MKQTNERLCALAQKGDATALDSLIDNNKSFIGKVANDLFRSMNLAQSGLNLDTDDLKQAGNMGLWKAVPKFDAARGMKFLTYAAPAIRNAMMDMVRDAFAAFEQRMVTEDKDGVCYQRVSLDDVLPGEEQLRRIETKQYVDKLIKKENIYELCKKCKNDSDSRLYCGEFGGMWNE